MSDDLNVRQRRPGARERRHLWVLVCHARELHSGLSRGAFKGADALEKRGSVARKLEAVTWALDRLGYPPARYEEVDREYAPARARERRQVRQAQLSALKGGDPE